MLIITESEFRLIECNICGCWEEMCIDNPRDDSQTFEWIENTDDGEAYYKCPDCGETVKSKTTTND